MQARPLLVAVLSATVIGCAYHTPTEPTPTPHTPPPADTPPVSAPAASPTSGLVNFGLNTIAPAVGQSTMFSYTILGGTATIQSIVLDFGDGETQPRPADPAYGSVTHTYGRSGAYTASLRVVDSVQARTVSQAFTVASPPATPTPPPPPPPPTPTLGLTLECTPATHGTASGCHVAMTDTTGAAITSTITSVDWDWGDGSTETDVAPPASALHTYAVAGNVTGYLVIAKAHAPAGTQIAQTTIKIP